MDRWRASGSDTAPFGDQREVGKGDSATSEKEKLAMRFSGKVYKEGKFWLAEIPVLDLMTQGHTRKEAFVMVSDLLETLVNRPEFSVRVHPDRHGNFEVSSSDARSLISLLLRRQREQSGLSLAEAAERLGAKSRNAYARYEQGRSIPSVEKLSELLRAVSSGRDFILQQSAVS
jgi:predicted RNase H-like HicB family nuclease/DNA-binding XRE family transcriptional regulator|tara:strand:+ start:485 stop:1006 length:522 start_codon:yes stop_codon:yes gene_type:complete